MLTSFIMWLEAFTPKHIVAVWMVPFALWMSIPAFHALLKYSLRRMLSGTFWARGPLDELINQNIMFREALLTGEQIKRRGRHFLEKQVDMEGANRQIADGIAEMIAERADGVVCKVRTVTFAALMLIGIVQAVAHNVETRMLEVHERNVILLNLEERAGAYRHHYGSSSSDSGN